RARLSQTCRCRNCLPPSRSPDACPRSSGGNLGCGAGGPKAEKRIAGNGDADRWFPARLKKLRPVSSGNGWPGAGVWIAGKGNRMRRYYFNIVYGGAGSEDVAFNFPSIEAARARAQDFADVLGANVRPSDRCWKILVTNMHGEPAFEQPLRGNVPAQT